MFRVLAFAATLSLAAAPALAAGLTAQASPTIDRANADWLPAMQARDGARIAAAYADDGVFVLPNGQTIVGRKAIADFYDKQLSSGRKVISADIHTDGLSEAAGGLVIEWGHAGTTSVDAA